MKIISVMFPDTVNLTLLPKGTTEVSVTSSTQTLTGGVVMATVDVIDLPNQIFGRPVIIEPAL